MIRKQLTDQELDALIVRSLSRLSVHAPSRVFESRVMSRVRLPAPQAVAAYRRARSWVAQPRRATTLAGAYAVAVAVALVALVPWLFVHGPDIRLAVDWTAQRLLGIVRETAIGFAGWTMSSGIASRVGQLPFSAAQVSAAAVTLAAGYAGCGAGLHVLMREPGGKGAGVQVQA